MANSALGGPRPLDRVRSIKVKLGIVVVGAVAATVGAIYLSLSAGLHARFAFLGGLIVSVVVIQLLAHGMVQPLREMVAATKAMASGDYSQRVTATALDEVGALAASFNTMAAKLDLVERQRRDLIANVSHELRTPIAALRARLENLADGVEALDAEAVATMLRGIERLGKLVDQLLKLSQFESGAIELDRQRFPLCEVVDDAVAQVHPIGSDLRIAVAVDDAVVVSGDPERIHDVLTNLIANAVRHSPPGGEITIKGTAVADRVRVEVSDLGPGIPPGDADRIFDRFYRVDAARGAQADGAGLGLAIARSIIELHGGLIWAQAAPAAQDARSAQDAPPGGCRIVFEVPA